MSATLRVSEISAASPDMDDEQFNELVEDIRKNGQLVPIWKCGDEIIDGRKRAQACSILGISAKVVNVSADMDAAALSHSLNILRTHYTASQRAMFAARMANATSADGSAIRQATPGKFAGGKIITNDQAAKRVDVSPRVVRQAKQIIREAAPEVIKAVEAGQLSIHTACIIAENVPKPEQAKAVIAKLNAPKRTDGRIVGKVNGFKRSHVLPINEGMQRALDQLENAVELLGKWFREESARDHPDREQWRKR